MRLIRFEHEVSQLYVAYGKQNADLKLLLRCNRFGSQVSCMYDNYTNIRTIFILEIVMSNLMGAEHDIYVITYLDI